MFQISATQKTGTCPAKRCNADPDNIGAELNPNGLCSRHFGEWISAGRPALVAALPKARTAANDTTPGMDEAAIAVIKDKAAASLAMLKEFAIESQDDMDFAGELLAGVKQELGALEEMRQSVTKPLNEALKRFNDLCRPGREVLQNCEIILKRKVSDFLLAQQALQDAALKAVAAAPEVVGAPVLAVAHGVENVQNAPTLSTRTVYRVQAIHAEKLPTDYWIIDEARITREVKALGVQAPIVLSGAVSVERDISVINRG